MFILAHQFCSIRGERFPHYTYPHQTGARLGASAYEWRPDAALVPPLKRAGGPCPDNPRSPDQCQTEQYGENTAYRELSNAVTMRSIVSGSKDDPGINFLIGIKAVLTRRQEYGTSRALKDVPTSVLV